MKTTVFFLMACLLNTVTGCAATKTVEGNGKIITKEITISDYDEISTVGVIEFIYEQSTAAPYLKISIDENLFPLLKATVKNKELTVSPKKINENGQYGNTYNLRPTTFKVITNSRKLKQLNVVSSGDFIAAGPIDTESLEINIAGSGNVFFEKGIQGEKMEINLASSGKMIASRMELAKIECNLAGSGKIQLTGKAERAEYNLAASGNINAYECVINEVECNIAGSGNIHTYVKNQLTVNIAGSGDVYYKGNPTTTKNVVGSGKLKKAD